VYGNTITYIDVDGNLCTYSLLSETSTVVWVPDTDEVCRYPKMGDRSIVVCIKSPGKYTISRYDMISETMNIDNIVYTNNEFPPEFYQAYGRDVYSGRLWMYYGNPDNKHRESWQFSMYKDRFDVISDRQMVGISLNTNIYTNVKEGYPHLQIAPAVTKGMGSEIGIYEEKRSLTVSGDNDLIAVGTVDGNIVALELNSNPVPTPIPTNSPTPSFTLTPTSSPSPYPTPPPSGGLGDFNGDGEINNVDAWICWNALGGNDMNQDGRITETDAWLSWYTSVINK
jgi:hypothetical protein